MKARLHARASRPPSRPASRTGRAPSRSAIRAPVWAACVLGALGVGFAAMHSRGGEEAQDAAPEARPAAAARADASAPWVVREGPPPVVPVRLPPPEMTPLFDPNMRLHLGETATLKFAAQDVDRRAQRGQVTASVFHGRDPERRLPVHEVDPGVYEVPFQPYGPGQFQVVLSVDGVPAGSHRLGVIGAVGRSDGAVDLVDPLSVDPRDFRARTGGHFRRR